MNSNNRETTPAGISERLFRRGDRERFEQRVEALRARADTLGVSTHISVTRDDESLYSDETALFGASIGKLPLADMVIHMMHSDETWQIEPDLVDTTGGGVFDQEPRSEATTAELLEDMLRNSGNTAFRVLARGLGGPNQINEYYDTKWSNTHVESDGQTGRATLGTTTADESAAQMREVLLGTGGDERLRQRALLALHHSSATDRGIRRHVKRFDNPVIFNKIGQYNGDEDDPFVFRHDVGLVKGERGSLTYAILTSSPMKMRGFIANMVVSRFGAEVACESSGRNVITLGSRATRLVL